MNGSIVNVQSLLKEISKQINTKAQINQENPKPAKFNVFDGQEEPKKSPIVLPGEPQKVSIKFGLSVVTDGKEVWLEQGKRILPQEQFPKLYKLRVSILSSLFKKNGYKIN